MTDRKRKINERVRQTLAELERVENIEPGPHFYARLQNRLQSDPQRGGLAQSFLQPRFWLKPALFAVLVIFNIFTLARFIDNREESQLSRADYLESLAQDYNLEIDYYSGGTYNE